MSGFNLDWLLGPRNWSVIDDGTTGFAAHDWYACPTSRVDRGDVVILDGLRQREAFREAANLRAAKGAFQCLEIARGRSPKPRQPHPTKA